MSLILSKHSAILLAGLLILALGCLVSLIGLSAEERKRSIRHAAAAAQTARILASVRQEKMPANDARGVASAMSPNSSSAYSGLGVRHV